MFLRFKEFLKSLSPAKILGPNPFCAAPQVVDKLSLTIEAYNWEKMLDGVFCSFDLISSEYYAQKA